MSAHIAPQRWADTKLGEAERRAMDQHADTCTQCAKARERITGATSTFATLRAQTAPELAWDAIRAKIHWSVSSERRTQSRNAGRGAFLAWAAVAAGTVALGLGTGSIETPKSREPI